jgi:Ca2+/Na+ antiporter
MVALFPDVDSSASWGQIFTQAGLYGYILSIGADMIGDGAELLMLCPSIAPLVGSIVVPILGAVPDGMMVLCSGLGDDAQEQINVGVGALAGSTVMLLTLPWFLAILYGRVTLKDGEPTYKVPSDQKLMLLTDKYGKPLGGVPQFFNALFKSGVGVSDQVKENAKLMMVTTLPYWIIQVPAFMEDKASIPIRDQKDAEKPFGLAGAVLCVAFFCYYMIKMFRDATQEGSDVQAAIVKKTVEGIQNGQMTLLGAMHEFREATASEMQAGNLKENLLDSKKNSKAEETVRHMCKVLEPFFKNYDANGDNQINIYEFRLLMQDLRESVPEEKTKQIFDAADMDKSGGINFEEFVACIMAFALDPFQPDEEPAGKLDDAGDGDDGEEEEDIPPDLADLSPAEQQNAIKKRACQKMLVGTVLVCAFSDPMCDLLGTMGDKAHIPAFYVSFLIAPLASNASELVSAMKLAAKKTQSSMKESLSTLCGAAIMNNTFCLSIFFMCFIMKDLVWQFSAETLSIVLIQYAIGVIAITKNVQCLMDGFLILLCYPAAMGIVYLLKSFGGMD